MGVSMYLFYPADAGDEMKVCFGSNQLKDERKAASKVSPVLKLNCKKKKKHHLKLKHISPHSKS